MRTGLSQSGETLHAGALWRSLMRPQRNVGPRFSVTAASMPRLAICSRVSSQKVEYPDAVLIQTHRDPLRVVASVSALTAHLRRMASDHSSVAESAAEFAPYIFEGLDRSMQARDDGVLPLDQVVDVQFLEFLANPIATIDAIYGRLGLELSRDAERRMRAFLQ